MPSCRPADEVMGFDRVMPNFSIAQEATALGCQRLTRSDTDMMPNPTDAPWADHAIILCATRFDAKYQLDW